MEHPDFYQQILSHCTQLVKNGSHKAITAGQTGDTDFDAAAVVMNRCEFEVDGGSVEINLTTPTVRPPYHWLAEISMRGDLFGHYILTVDNTIEETYGKKVFSVEPEAAAKLYELLKDLHS